MRRIIITVALVVLASGLWKSYSVRFHQQSTSAAQKTDQTTLSSRVKKAKAAGATEVILPGPIPYLAEASGLDDAVAQYSVIIAKPTDVISTQVDVRNIMTYYKFRILETLSDRPGPSGGVPEELPAFLEPLRSDEIYILEGGGTVMIEGTKVTQKGQYEYAKDEKYLLFISKNSAQSIAMVSLGKYGVFSVKEDDLEGLVKEHSFLKRDLSQRHSNKIANLRAALKKTQ